MDIAQIIFYVAALILLVLAGIGVPAGRLSLGWLGMACWLIASTIVPLLR